MGKENMFDLAIAPSFWKKLCEWRANSGQTGGSVDSQLLNQQETELHQSDQFDFSQLNPANKIVHAFQLSVCSWFLEMCTCDAPRSESSTRNLTNFVLNLLLRRVENETYKVEKFVRESLSDRALDILCILFSSKTPLREEFRSRVVPIVLKLLSQDSFSLTEKILAVKILHVIFVENCSETIINYVVQNKLIEQIIDLVKTYMLRVSEEQSSMCLKTSSINSLLIPSESGSPSSAVCDKLIGLMISLQSSDDSCRDIINDQVRNSLQNVVSLFLLPEESTSLAEEEQISDFRRSSNVSFRSSFDETDEAEFHDMLANMALVIGQCDHRPQIGSQVVHAELGCCVITSVTADGYVTRRILDGLVTTCRSDDVTKVIPFYDLGNLLIGESDLQLWNKLFILGVLHWGEFAGSPNNDGNPSKSSILTIQVESMLVNVLRLVSREKESLRKILLSNVDTSLETGADLGNQVNLKRLLQSATEPSPLKPIFDINQVQNAIDFTSKLLLNPGSPAVVENSVNLEVSLDGSQPADSSFVADPQLGEMEDFLSSLENEASSSGVGLTSATCSASGDPRSNNRPIDAWSGPPPIILSDGVLVEPPLPRTKTTSRRAIGPVSLSSPTHEISTLVSQGIEMGFERAHVELAVNTLTQASSIDGYRPRIEAVVSWLVENPSFSEVSEEVHDVVEISSDASTLTISDNERLNATAETIDSLVERMSETLQRTTDLTEIFTELRETLRNQSACSTTDAILGTDWNSDDDGDDDSNSEENSVSLDQEPEITEQESQQAVQESEQSLTESGTHVSSLNSSTDAVNSRVQVGSHTNSAGFKTRQAFVTNGDYAMYVREHIQVGMLVSCSLSLTYRTKETYAEQIVNKRNFKSAG